LVGLLGRLAELAACQGALSADSGDGAVAAVITGAPGIGKTSLWRAVADSQPAGGLVLRTTGVPSSQVAFANLADLLDPVAEQVLPSLPAPQASALRAALGLAAAEGPPGEMLLERAAVAALGSLAQAGFDACGGWVIRVVCDPEWRAGNLVFLTAG
jgi:AAA ATPase domain